MSGSLDSRLTTASVVAAVLKALSIIFLVLELVVIVAAATTYGDDDDDSGEDTFLAYEDDDDGGGAKVIGFAVVAGALLLPVAFAALLYGVALALDFLVADLDVRYSDDPDPPARADRRSKWDAIKRGPQ